MKLLALFVTLLATVCYIEAYNFDVTLACSYKEDVPTNGNLTITLNGESTTEKKYFSQSFDGLAEINFKTKFYEKIKNVEVKWDSESKKPLYLDYLYIDIDSGKTKIKFFKQKYVFNGKTEIFYKNPY